MLTLSKALKTGQLREFIAQEEDRGVASVDLKEFEDLAARLIKTRHKKIKHRVPPVAVVRAESKFPQILVEMLPRNMNIR